MNYNRDVFIEQMVKKDFSGKDALTLLGIGAGGAVIILLGILAFLISGNFAIAFFGVVIAIAGCIFLGSKLLLEFEYTFTNGDLSIDKIMNRRSRKRLTSFDCKEVQDFGKYLPKASELKTRRVDKRIYASKNLKSEAAYYLIVKSRKTGLTLLVFDPDEKTYEAMKQFFPREIKMQLMSEEQSRKYSKEA